MTKQVQWSDRAYTLLSRCKPHNESFSDTVIRLAQAGQDLWGFVGRYASKLLLADRLKAAREMKGPAL